MSIFRRHIILVAIVLMTQHITAIHAQETLPPSWRDYAEYQYDGEIDLDELTEIFEQYADNPINLNDTNSDRLAELFFISPFQQAALKAYIEQRGDLLSVNELRLINGFDSLTIELLKPITTAGAIERQIPFSWKKMISQGKHHIAMGSNGTIEPQRGYLNKKYEGDPYRLYFRYKYSYKDQVDLQFSGDKDPGEAFFSGSQKQGFDHYGYHLRLRNIGIVKQAIIGRYNLQFGQGVTLWSGFSPYYSWGGINYRSAQGIQTASPFAEYNYLNGGAVTLKITPHIEITPFYSNQRRDATVPKSMAGEKDGGYEMVQSFYQSGYHRTENEIAKKGQIGEQLWGANVRYAGERLKIGITAYKTLLDKKVKPSDSYRYNYYYFRGYHNFDIGIDGAYRYKGAIFYGELSMSENKRMGGVVGTDLMIGTKHHIGIYYRDYDATYWNLHASGPGKNTQNERGAAFNLRSELPFGLKAEATIDLAHYPEMKSGVYGTSNSIEGRTRIEKEFNQHLSLTLYYRHKQQGANIKEGNGYRIGTAINNQIQGEINLNIGAIESRTRGTYTHYRLGEKQSHGWLLFEDLAYRPSGTALEISGRVVLFDIMDYDARIYAVESGLMYDNSSTFFMDRGERAYIVVHWDIGEHIALGMKYSITNYTNRETIGSGDETIDGPHKQQWKIQLRMKF